MPTKSFLIAGCLLSATLSAQTTVTVSTEGIEAAGKGKVIALLFASADGFPREHEKAAFRLESKDFGDEVSFTFPDVPPGEYAMLLFQDLNENDEVDTNFIGVPKEPLGLANMQSMGRPSFNKVKVEVGDEPVNVTIKLMNQ